MGEVISTNGNGANVVEIFAQRLVEAADKDQERLRRADIVTDMFRGHARLLEQDFSFEEMFDAFNERIFERGIGGVVRDFVDTLKGIRGRARRFW